MPKAKGEQSRQLEQAAAYREHLIQEADGEAKRFLSVYDAYKTGKDDQRAGYGLNRCRMF